MITNEPPARQSVAETFSPGQKLAENFTLKRKVSGGITGVTWLAQDEEQGREVALLFLPDSLLGDPRAMGQLRREVRQNRQLIHPHVQRVHEFVEDADWVAISSDYVEGETLASLLAKKENGCFETAEIKPWIGTICRTLEEAHQAGLLHRDLAPANILLKKNGDLVIANFGISRAILDALQRAQPRDADGRLAYTSPQQLDGEIPDRCDDVYSLGVLIYELLTGRPPFYSGDIVAQIRKTAPVSISARRAELGIKGEPIPPQWEKAVASCLEKHTGPRPGSIAEIAAKLSADGHAPVASPRAAQAPVTAKTGQQPAESQPRKKSESPAPSKADSNAPGSFAHLLEKISGMEEPQRKKFPVGIVAVALVVLAGLLMFLFHGGREKSAPKTAAASPSEAPVVAKSGSEQGPKPQPAASATPAQTSKTTAASSATPVPVVPAPVSPEQMKAAEQVRKAIEAVVTVRQEKAKLQMQAEADAQQAQKEVEAKIAAAAALKKSLEDAENQRKQQEEAEKKAAAEADAAQKAAEEKARLASETKKATEQTLSQIKEQEAARQKADAEVQELEKAAAEKQRLAAEAAKAFKQTDGLKPQLNPTPSPSQPHPSPTVAPQPNAQASPLPNEPKTGAETPAPIGPEKMATPNPIEFAEKTVVNQIALQKLEQAGSTPVVTTVPGPGEANPKTQPDQKMVNSLGMKFAPVGDVLFCIWLTRVKDFDTFATATGFKGTMWRQPGFKQGPDHPVVDVTWQDAMAFCKWLTEKERKAGLLAPNQIYRLPTDLEWSKAVGLPAETGRTPYDRDMGVPDVYPWGTQWPPPAGAGNYTGEETGSDVAIKGYDDGYAWTAPVGSFAPNKYGLYDMGGNAWQWCMDWLTSEQKAKVLRGASWYNGGLKLSLLSSCRLSSAPDSTTDNYGFRVVIATEGKPSKK